MTTYFSKQTGLTLKSEMLMQSQMGEIKVENYIMEYVDFGGLKLPKRAVEIAAGVESHVTIESVEHNVEISEDRFKIPAEIQAILDRRKSD